MKIVKLRSTNNLDERLAFVLTKSSLEELSKNKSVSRVGRPKPANMKRYPHYHLLSNEELRKIEHRIEQKKKQESSK